MVRPFWKKRPVEEVDDELAFHVEMRTRELMARGIDQDSARRQAIARFGDLGAVTDTCRTIAEERDRSVRRTEYFSELRDDIRFALRQLRRSPGFSAVAVLTLALGVGATTAIFSAVHAVVLRSFAYDDPARVLIVGETWQTHEVAEASAGNYVDWQEQARSFEHLSAAQYGTFNLDDETSPERVAGAYTTWSFFPTFRVAPTLGRAFTIEEDQPGRDRVVVLSHGLWQRRFAGDAEILGRDVRINGRPHRVIGVMPEGFDPALAGEQFWVPIAFTPERRAMHDEHYLSVFGRLAAGVSIDQAREEMDRIGAQLRERYPIENSGRGVGMRRLDEWLVGDFRQRLFVMLGAVALVLLIACGNVANLLLARGAVRGKELAIRNAIGAGRARIVRQLLTENLVLSLFGAVAGVVIAWLLVDVLVAAAPSNIPRIDQTRIDGWVLLFALTLSIASAVVFGLAPALRAGRLGVRAALAEGGRHASGGARDHVRTGLVVLEVALSLTLLVGAGLLIRSALYLQRVDPGFDIEGLLAARVGFASRNATLDAAETSRKFTQILEEVRRQPGVADASLTSQAPLGPGSTGNGLLPEGKPFDMANVVASRLRMVTPGYLKTMGIELVRGRDLTEHDIRTSPLVMIVSEAAARAAWGDEDPIGKRVACCEGSPEDPRWKTVIGVARDVRSYGPAENARPEFYVPIAQVPAEAWNWIGYAMTIVARSHSRDAGAAAALAPAIRAAVRAVAPGVPVYGISVLEEALSESMAPQRFNSMLLGALGLVGLLLAAAGIYSVIAYFVSTRTQEIGIRMALGATARDVLALMTWQGIRPVLAGMVIGAVGAFWATRLIQGSLFGVQPNDAVTFVSVAGLLLIVALLATWVPARRATRVDPTRALNA